MNSLSKHITIQNLGHILKSKNYSLHQLEQIKLKDKFLENILNPQMYSHIVYQQYHKQTSMQLGIEHL